MPLIHRRATRRDQDPSRRARNTNRIATRSTVTLTALALVASGSISVASADPADTPSFEEQLAQVPEVTDAVPADATPVTDISADGTVTLGDPEATEISIDLPTTDGAESSDVDGRHVIENTDGSALAVNPTDEGAQVIIGIDGPESPTIYDFGLTVPEGFAPALTEDGGVDLVDADGFLAGHIETPWAVDANGQPVPTYFQVEGATVTQVVDHLGGDYAYPIVADPSLKMCDWGTAICVKFSKSETRRVNEAMLAGVSAAIGSLCGLIPMAGWGIPIRMACAGVVAAYYVALRGTFKSAKAQGRCVELKFNYIGQAFLRGWKVVSC